jgi:hypothetical protein
MALHTSGASRRILASLPATNAQRLRKGSEATKQSIALAV